MQLKLRRFIPHDCSEMQKLCLPRTGEKNFPEYCMHPKLLCSLTDNHRVTSVVFGIGQIFCMDAVFLQFLFQWSITLLLSQLNNSVHSQGNVSLSQIAFNSLTTGFPFSVFVYAQHERKNNSYQLCKTGEQCFLPSGTISKRVISQLFMYLPHRALFQEPQYTVPSHVGV